MDNKEKNTNLTQEESTGTWIAYRRKYPYVCIRCALEQLAAIIEGYCFGVY